MARAARNSPEDRQWHHCPVKRGKGREDQADSDLLHQSYPLEPTVGILFGPLRGSEFHKRVAANLPHRLVPRRGFPQSRLRRVRPKLRENGSSRHRVSQGREITRVQANEVIKSSRIRISRNSNFFSTLYEGNLTLSR